jgi:ketopantoate reductase
VGDAHQVADSLADAGSHKPAVLSDLEPWREAPPPTVRHESSTLQDIRARKATEIEALSGAVVRLGEEAGVPTPINWTLYKMVKFMEGR